MVPPILLSHLLVLSTWVLTTSTIEGVKPHPPESNLGRVEAGSSSTGDGKATARTEADENNVYVPGKKILLGAMAAHEFLWFGCEGTFLSMKEEFMKSDGERSWNPLQWLPFRKRNSWDEDLLEAFAHESIQEEPNEKQMLLKYLKASYKSTPYSENSSYGEDAAFVYKTILKLWIGVIRQSEFNLRFITSDVRELMRKHPVSSPQSTDLSDPTGQLQSASHVASDAISTNGFRELGCFIFSNMFVAILINFRYIVDTIFEHLSAMMNAERVNASSKRHFRHKFDDIYMILSASNQKRIFIDQIAKVLINDIMSDEAESSTQCMRFVAYGPPIMYRFSKAVNELYSYFNVKKILPRPSKYNPLNWLGRIYQHKDGSRLNQE